MVIRHGDTGAAVAEVRARLAHLGLLPDSTIVNSPTVNAGMVDVFDDALDRAVRTFQQERGLTVDGIVGPQTFRRLDEARWQLGDRVLRYTPGHLVTGDDVAELQRRLNELGFDSGRADGFFGVNTDLALREFQRDVGVDADGICGPGSFKAFDRLMRTISGGNAAQLRDHVSLASLQTGISGKVVLIDPGSDLGVDICQAVAVRVEGRLAALGTQVLLTHLAQPSGVLDEAERANFANRTGADLVVSIHVTQIVSPTPSGAATFYFGAPDGGAHSANGRALAELIQNELCGRTSALDCRTHPRTWDLLRLTRVPAVRVELGYLSNPVDAARLCDVRMQDASAEAIATGIKRFCAPG
ncbi:MAG: N-acetylmuramoyl-L-alanine amidase [Candidatus Nanopelagicales bacterium]|nr:N-acetylmuramoyl-L-alanine amidase [Candidatus Nanopelagicales bacterium]